MCYARAVLTDSDIRWCVQQDEPTPFSSFCFQGSRGFGELCAERQLALCLRLDSLDGYFAQTPVCREFCNFFQVALKKTSVSLATVDAEQ